MKKCTPAICTAYSEEQKESTFGFEEAKTEKRRILLTNVPRDYIAISSGLGEAAPLNIIVLPVLFEGEVKGMPAADRAPRPA